MRGAGAALRSPGDERPTRIRVCGVRRARGSAPAWGPMHSGTTHTGTASSGPARSGPTRHRVAARPDPTAAPQAPPTTSGDSP